MIKVTIQQDEYYSQKNWDVFYCHNFESAKRFFKKYFERIFDECKTDSFMNELDNTEFEFNSNIKNNYREFYVLEDNNTHRAEENKFSVEYILLH